MEKYYSINELAKMFNITTNKIRFYEKKGLLESIRGEENNYRKFTENHVVKLQAILLYRSIGLSIDDIKSMIMNNEKENYLDHFNSQWQLVNNEIQRLSEIRKSLESIIDKIYEKPKELEFQDDLLKIIDESNKLYHIKNNWKDKWNFNNWAKFYDKDVKADKGSLQIYKNYEEILQSVYEDVSELKESNAKVLDIGVGTGNLSSKFLKGNYDVIGIDQSREMLNVAKKKFPELKVRLGEFLKIPFENKTFDAIVSTYAFHHLNESEKIIAIEEMLRVLKDNGIIVIGDLMFENKVEEEKIFKELSQDEIKAIKDEYYSYIDILKSEFEKHNKKLSYRRIDRLNYIIKVK